MDFKKKKDKQKTSKQTEKHEYFTRTPKRKGSKDTSLPSQKTEQREKEKEVQNKEVTACEMKKKEREK